MPQQHTTPGGTTVTIPAYSDIADAPKAFSDFADSLTAGGKVTIADTAPPQRAATLWYQGSTGKMYVSDGTAWIQTGGTL